MTNSDRKSGVEKRNPLFSKGTHVVLTATDDEGNTYISDGEVIDNQFVLTETIKLYNEDGTESGDTVDYVYTYQLAE